MEKRVRLIISGRVQGVCFRMAVRDQAIKEGVHGWVRNLDEGSVEAVIEGTPDATARMIEFCRHGPRHAVVDSIAIQEESWRGEYKEFLITY